MSNNNKVLNYLSLLSEELKDLKYSIDELIFSYDDGVKRGVFESKETTIYEVERIIRQLEDFKKDIDEKSFKELFKDQ